MVLDFPFNIGDKVYTIDFEDEKTFIAERIVDSVEVNEFGKIVWVKTIDDQYDSFVYEEDWGDTYFKFREEAEYYRQNGD